MEHSKKLAEIHKEAMEKIDAYLLTQNVAAEKHQQQINNAKDKWQDAWNEFLQTLVVLDKLEI